MGYSTDFLGSLHFSRPLRDQEMDYINALTQCRRMKLDVAKLHETYKGAHGNPFAKTDADVYGVDGEYFTQELSYDDPCVSNYNSPPGTQPGLWCHWTVSKKELTWDGGEKFYKYVEWLQYFIRHFFDKWGIALDGAMQWQGERREDRGTISVWRSRIHIHHDACDESDDNEDVEEADM